MNKERFLKEASADMFVIKNPDNDEAARIIKEQTKNPYIEIQQAVVDPISGTDISTSTYVPFLMEKHGLSEGIITLIDNFQNHSEEVNTELRIRKQKP
jgi:hypothetical protein